MVHSRSLKARERKELSFDRETIRDKDERVSRDKSYKYIFQNNFEDNSRSDNSGQGHVPSNEDTSNKGGAISSSGHGMVLRTRSNVKYF